MNPFEHGLRNAQRNIPSLVPRTALTYNKHARLILEKFTNLISAQIPHLSDFRNGVVALGGYRSDDADGNSSGLQNRFFQAVLIVIRHRATSCMVYTYSTIQMAVQGEMRNETSEDRSGRR